MQKAIIDKLVGVIPKEKIDEMRKAAGIEENIEPEKSEPTEKDEDLKIEPEKTLPATKDDDKKADTTKGGNISEPKNIAVKTDTKKIENELSKLKIDNALIAKRKTELLGKGYTESEAKEIAELESIINLSNKRIAIFENSPTLKDQEKRLNSVKKVLEENTIMALYCIGNQVKQTKNSKC